MSTRRALGLAAVFVLSCQGKPAPPEEKWLVVTSEVAPLLRKVKPDADPHDYLRAGELARWDHDLQELRWTGKLDGEKGQREGMVFELRYATEGMILHGFKPDFAQETSVPVTSWLCETIGAQGPFDKAVCPARLRRARTAGGGLLVYMACASGPCPVGLHRDGRMSVITVENITNARFYLGKARSMLLVEARWSKDGGKQSGGQVIPVLAEGDTLVPKDPITVDHIDARDPARVTARTVQYHATMTEITLTGEETVTAADGTVLSQKKIDEKHPLPSLF